jgi:Protein of unknown function with PCYCGC motif
MFKRIKFIVTLLGGTLIVAAVNFLAFPVSTGVQVAVAQAGESEAQAAENLRVTLDPKQFQGEVRKAYQVAQDDPALLAQLHCYCGCDKADGHRNLLDCYRTDHGAHCEICVGEATDAEAMAKRGMSIDQIRDALRARYAHED